MIVRSTIAGVTLLCLGGCLDWQGTYDSAARRDCEKILSAEERQECLTWVEHNGSEHRTERRQ